MATRNMDREEVWIEIVPVVRRCPKKKRLSPPLLDRNSPLRHRCKRCRKVSFYPCAILPNDPKFFGDDLCGSCRMEVWKAEGRIKITKARAPKNRKKKRRRRI